MVLQIGANTGERVTQWHACPRKHRLGADTRQLQQLRRTDGTRSQQHLGTGADVPALTATDDVDAGAARATEVEPQRCVPVSTARLPRCRTVRRNALAVFQRTPRFWFTSK